MAGVELRPALQAPEGALHAAFGAAFADYLIGPFQLTPAQWPGFLARQGVDLALSRVACDPQGEVQAFALVAPRATRWRLATMGARPQARGSGAAQQLLDDFIARATAAGLPAVELEVFEQNAAALRLYRSRGFVARHALFGYRRAAPGGTAQAPGFDDVGREAALQWLAAQSVADLPLQVGAQVLALNSGPWQAWQCRSAQLVFDATTARLQLLSLIDPEPGQPGASALLLALGAAYPQLEASVPQLQRRDLGGEALERLGFERLALNQLLMCRELRG